MEGLQFTNITIESLFYERLWLGGAEPIHITAMPRAVNTQVEFRRCSMTSSSPGHLPAPKQRNSLKFCHTQLKTRLEHCVMGHTAQPLARAGV